MICANLNSWSGSCATRQGHLPRPALVSFLPAKRAREARADCCGADCTNYIRAKASWVKRQKRASPGLRSGPLGVRRASNATVSRRTGQPRLPEIPIYGLRSFRKTERKTTISPVLGRRKLVRPEFVRIWRIKAFGTSIALPRVFEACAVPRSRAANVRR